MRPRDEYKEQLVKEKAIEMIIKRGLDGFSMQKLARVAGVSPATLYIYYKDKEDLIIQLGIEETKRLSSMFLKGFRPEMTFEEGMRVQWRNRAEYWLSDPGRAGFLELIKHSSYRDKVHLAMDGVFIKAMGSFIQNAIDREEIAPIKKEIFWSIAYAPLYNLIRFHTEGISFAGDVFQFSEELMWQTFDLVMKALKKN